VGGIDFNLSERWFLSLDVRWVDMDSEMRVDGDRLGVVSFDPLMAGAMVGYRFGGTSYKAPQVEEPPPPPPPPPAAAPVAVAPTACTDSDGDGICDVDDKCPNTPAGDTVDQFGCSLVSRLMIFFDFDRAELRPESIRELERVVDFMNQLPVATALIEGHTDSLGSTAYNQSLSERRAKSVYDYLTSRGVNPGRLQAMGKGETSPIADNTTETGRQQNRRVMLIRTDSGS
jgi:outer membrane protein OmpA-like peptidoglycan-associated protein